MDTIYTADAQSWMRWSSNGIWKVNSVGLWKTIVHSRFKFRFGIMCYANVSPALGVPYERAVYVIPRHCSFPRMASNGSIKKISIPGDWKSVVVSSSKSSKCHKTNRLRIRPGFSVTLSPIIALVSSLVPAYTNVETYSWESLHLSTESMCHRLAPIDASNPTSFRLRDSRVLNKRWANCWALVIPVCINSPYSQIDAQARFLICYGARATVSIHTDVQAYSALSSVGLHRSGHRRSI